MSTSPKPACRKAVAWVKSAENGFGKETFAPFTGQDMRAFAAFTHLVELYLCSDPHGQRAALDGMRACLRAAQPNANVRIIFKMSIPAIGDWSHEDEIWRQIT